MKAILTLLTALLAPFVVLAVVLLLPFSDRPTQVMLMLSEAAYLGIAGGIL
jgi:hypothetical protein